MPYIWERLVTFHFPKSRRKEKITSNQGTTFSKLEIVRSWRFLVNEPFVKLDKEHLRLMNTSFFFQLAGYNFNLEKEQTFYGLPLLNYRECRNPDRQTHRLKKIVLEKKN